MSVLMVSSFIRQDNSYSRLQISKNVFAVLAGELQVYLQLPEFLVDFKWKLRETEVGPPRINFRPLLSPLSQLQDASAGFGTVQNTPNNR